MKNYEKLKKNKLYKKIVISIAILLVGGISAFFYFYNSYGFLMKDTEKANRIHELLKNKDYDEARVKLEKYYGNPTEKKEQITKDLLKNIIDTCELSNTTNIEEAIKYVENLKEAKDSAVKIVDTKVEDDYSSKYKDIVVIVKNNGKKDVNYVKINLFFKDVNGNVVASDWTNDSSCIKPNAKQKIKHMVKKDNWTSVEAEIAECR